MDKDDSNRRKVYKIIERIDEKFNAQFSNCEEYKIFATMLKIRNSFAHGSDGFISIESKDKYEDILDDEIKVLKQKNIIAIESSSNLHRHWIKNDFSQFLTLHDFCILLIDKLKQIISTNSEN